MVRGRLNIALVGGLLSILFFSCKFSGDGGKETLPSSSGKYGEVLVVVDTSFLKGPIGQKINEIFLKALDATPQKEASFRMSTVDPYDFKSILKRSRNLLRVNLDPKSQNKVKVDRDVWASDQLLINISADSEESALRILEKNEQTIRDYFNQEELKRLLKQFKGKPNNELMAEIKERYNVGILIPPAYLMMENDSASFWIKKEKTIGEHQIIQGLIVYSHPYISDSTFSANYMTEQRNTATKRMVQGTRDSSFMQVYSEFQPISRELNLDNKYTVMYKGLWNMKNDFMGGPFIHYTLVDEKRNRVIDIDGFVYAPKFNKREYLRELEAMISTLKLN